MNETRQAIGIFDSGLGGLTVLKDLKAEIPNEKFIYFGDIGRLPYGNKSKKSIIKYSTQISQFLLSKNIKSLIVACNTASAIAYNQLNNLLDIPVFNVIDASVSEAIKCTKTKCITVIGTDATIYSHAYKNKIHEYDNNIKVIEKSCPLFVPIVEENLINNPFTYNIVEYYLYKVIQTETDTLILGCTHYPLLSKVLKKFLGHKIQIISSSRVSAKHVKKEMSKLQLLTKDKKSVHDSFYVSDKPHKFNQLAKIFLNQNSIDVQQVSI